MLAPIYYCLMALGQGRKPNFEAIQRALQNTNPDNLSREWLKQDTDFKHLQQQYPHEWQPFICHLC